MGYGFLYKPKQPEHHVSPMKIMILGAGQVGGTLAQSLASEHFDVTLVDENPEVLRSLQDKYDIRTVAGKASFPSVLRQAGAEDTDILIAVTNSDEVNMVACQIAYRVFNTPTKIARIRSTAYLLNTSLFSNEAIPIDVAICPEQLVTDNVKRLIERPGALQVLDFSDGKVQLVAVRAFYGGPLVGRALSNLKEHVPSVDTRVAAIFRKGRPIIPQGDTIIEVDDEVFFIAAKSDIRTVMSELQRLENPYKKIMIAGGGNIGERLAEGIESRYQVKILERSADRCRYLSENLDRSIILNSDASNQNLLLEENIENTDVFCALTNNDEANIMSSLLAKRLGAKRVMTLISNPAYVDLIHGGEIDIAISPQMITVGHLLRHVRQVDIANVYSLRRGAAEAIEVVAHGDKQSSKVIGRKIEDIKLPPGTTIGALVRDTQVIIAHDHIVIEAEDHVILFLVDKRRIREVEKLFQVGINFF
ncbi:MAG: Trk system potassium transporter TrkA [Pseudomonadales bacterium]|nr:Trk system potassium transporter TrkA [Pseudomonadales bacterium]